MLSIDTRYSKTRPNLSPPPNCIPPFYVRNSPEARLLAERPRDLEIKLRSIWAVKMLATRPDAQQSPSLHIRALLRASRTDALGEHETKDRLNILAEIAFQKLLYAQTFESGRTLLYDIRSLAEQKGYEKLLDWSTTTLQRIEQDKRTFQETMGKIAANQTMLHLRNLIDEIETNQTIKDPERDDFVNKTKWYMRDIGAYHKPLHPPLSISKSQWERLALLHALAYLERFYTSEVLSTKKIQTLKQSTCQLPIQGFLLDYFWKIKKLTKKTMTKGHQLTDKTTFFHLLRERVLTRIADWEECFATLIKEKKRPFVLDQPPARLSGFNTTIEEIDDVRLWVERWEEIIEHYSRMHDTKIPADMQELVEETSLKINEIDALAYRQAHQETGRETSSSSGV